jgi:hypothetical protein
LECPECGYMNEVPDIEEEFATPPEEDADED